MEKVCVFIGHRDAQPAIWGKLLAAVEFTINELGVTEFYVGGYGRFDSMAAEAVRNAQQLHPETRLYLIYAYLPVHKDGFTSERYDATLFPEGLESSPRRFAISKRNRTYHCAGFLEGAAVNTSRQLDNLVLNGMEPFDWSEARPFEYGYIAGQNVKLTDISGAETNKRIREEAAADFLPEVEKVMQSSGVSVQTETGNIDTLSVLLPVYFMKSGKLTAVMNGQTGRISVSESRKKKSNPWMLEPLLYSLLATLLLGSFYRFSPFPLLLFGFVFASIFFAAMGDGRHSLIRNVMLRSEAAKARREDGELKIDEARDILKNPYDNTPVFYERNDQGQIVPVKVRFYSFGRWLSICKNTFVLVFLPALIAALLRFGQMEPWESFMDGYKIGYGAVWYVLTGFIAILYLAKGVRRDVYDHPILYEILPDGRKRLIGKRVDRKIGVLAMFGVGKKDSNGKKLTLFRLIGALDGLGIFLFAVVLIALFGSIAAIIA